MDAQSVEIVGRNYLVSQLVRDGLEVARPERDRGVDLIACLDLDETGGGFVACPIQMKAASARQFGVARKYEKFSKLLFAYVWNVHEPGKACTYALTFPKRLVSPKRWAGRRPPRGEEAPKRRADAGFMTLRRRQPS